ncbi:MAG TPA: glucosamine-6-phosphate deaminase [Polyangia bacterium]|nr:glucosamine-6-phosphate deaminase [Polyangia bacterium]
MEVIVVPTADDACLRAARIVARLLRAKPETALALPTGSTPRAIYAELVRQHRDEGLSFARATAFSLDEYVGLRPDHPGSFRRALHEALYRHVDLPPDRAHAPDGQAADLLGACARYEAAIVAAGGLDLALLGLGTDGHIAFNEPTSSFGSRTRLKTLTDETRAANQASFAASGAEAVPHHALTVGIATILSARRCLLVAFGAAKAAAVAKMAEGPLAALVPASALQLHPHATVIVDEAAAEGLALRTYYDAVAAAKPTWQREE